MGDFTKGYTFQENETPTPSKFHQLIEDAMLGAVVNTARQNTGHQMVNLSEPAAADGNNEIAADGKFQFRYGGSLQKPADGFQVVEIFTNRTGGTVTVGDVMVIDTANDDSVVFVGASDDASQARVVGVVKTETASLGAVPVVIKGIATVRKTLFLAADVGQWLVPQQGNLELSQADVISPTATLAGNEAFATVMEDVLAAAPTVRAKIWR